ncbi:hypothetical protein DQ04_01551080 [Trypanosoma grayi]|uniref:hypothetical protein n=1 Tax=Trypanosoma grayi TaxID=71804 RepID=UPI0004F4B356|nr:hypothetical protein DQ04_01551080 [Trypanosoma grayi]KEG12653.1 hypothetical protein DQ04_01551080 [Trypanosoma grayi]
MLTALHITLPKAGTHRNGYQQHDQKHLPNRCLLVKEATCEATLISTEASRKYADDAACELHNAGTRFRFDHVTISPHHGSIFVAQVAPLLYDLCRNFFLTSHLSGPVSEGKSMTGIDTSRSGSTQQRWDSVSMGSYKEFPGKLRSLSRTIFICGSQSATDRRALFLHLAKATAQALLQQTDASSSPSQERGSCDVSFSLVDLYHAWGVGDVLDPNAVLHHSDQLDRLRREKPRRLVNEPKGIAFVEPTRQTLKGRDNASLSILRAMQRTDAPRALRTDAEKADHAIKSTLVLTFTISRTSGGGVAVRHGSVRKPGAEQQQQGTRLFEAKLHLTLLPDSTAAAHGQQVARELGALASALQACAQWQDEGSAMTAVKHRDPLSAPVSPSTNVSWAPLRESPLLLYLFESTMYYARQTERSLRQLRLADERRRLNDSESRSVSVNTSTQSRSTAKSPSTGTALSAEHGWWLGADASCSHVIACIAAGIGKCLLVVCVNSGWDQYFQARSVFLFAQRATNQLGSLRTLPESTSEEGTPGSVAKPRSTTKICSPYARHHQEQQQHQQEEMFLTLQQTLEEVENPLWSTPQRRENTEPRHVREEESPISARAPSDVPIQEEDGEDGSEDGRGCNNNNKSYNCVVLENCSPTLLPIRRETNAVRQRGATQAASASRGSGLHVSSSQKNVCQYSVQKLSPCGAAQGSGAAAVVGALASMHPYAPQEDAVEHDTSTAYLHTGAAATTPTLQQGQRPRNVEVVHASQALPLEGLCSGSSHLPNETQSGLSQGSPKNLMNVTPLQQQLQLHQQREVFLLGENERLRALVAKLASQQAAAVPEEQRATGIADVRDTVPVQLRAVVRSVELQGLQEELVATTKRARVLRRTLSRSMEENRKMRRVIHSQLRQCLFELPRVVREAVAERGAPSPTVMEEKLYRLEKLLEITADRVMRSVREDVGEGEEPNDYDDDEEEKNFEPRRRQQRHRCVRSGTRTMGDADPQTNDAARRRQQTFQAPVAGRVTQNSGVGKEVDAQVVQLLRVAYRLFLSDTSPGDKKSRGMRNDDADEADLNELCNEDKKVGNASRVRRSLSKSVLEILSPRQKQEEDGERKAVREGAFDEEVSGRRTPRRDFCWRCRVSVCTRQNAVYATFLDLVRSLCDRIRADGTLDRGPLAPCSEAEETEHNRDYRETKRRGPLPLNSRSTEWPGDDLPQNGGESLLLQARRLTTALKQRTDTHEREQAMVQQLQGELDKEREWRRQLQDELLRLRLRVNKYESKLNFIDETVKPKLSSDIVQLEKMMSERRKQHDLERQQRALFVSEVQKRLERVAVEADVNSFPYSSSCHFSPREDERCQDGSVE